MYTSEGILHYTQEDNIYRLVVNVDKELARYYRSLIPKCMFTNDGMRYDPHITVVRPVKEIPVNLQYWNKYQNKPVVFFYDSEIKFGKVYYWLNVFCKDLELIRLELGLPVVSEYTLPPEGFLKCFHLTIANQK